MRCTRYRHALSARLDGEELGMPAHRLDAHLAGCDDCRAWALAAGRATGALGDGPSQPDLRPDVLAALLQGAAEPRRTLLSLGEWRAVLAVVAVVQLVVAWPGVLTDDGHASAHLAHELTSWDVGLALGFLVLALMPSRAWGALPLAAVMVVALAGTSVADLVNGHALLGREAVHALELAGLGCVWVLARRVPRPSVVLRLA
jgi:predicted anti-sigma-YlaC factor YlaD